MLNVRIVTKTMNFLQVNFVVKNVPKNTLCKNDSKNNNVFNGFKNGDKL